MIQVRIALDAEGLLQSCGIEGHADAGPRGSDVVCAAVSILSRTALTTLSRAEGVTVQGSASMRGQLSIMADCTPSGAPFLAATTAFLVEGLQSVAAEYPDHCNVLIVTERRKHHGS